MDLDAAIATFAGDSVFAAHLGRVQAALDEMPLPRTAAAAKPAAATAAAPMDVDSDDNAKKESVPAAAADRDSPAPAPRIRPLEELLRIKQQEDAAAAAAAPAPAAAPPPTVAQPPKAASDLRIAHACYMRDAARAGEAVGHEKYRVGARFYGERPPKQDVYAAMQRGVLRAGGLLAYLPRPRREGGRQPPVFVARLMEGGYVEYAEYVSGHRRAKWLSSQQYDAVCEWRAEDGRGPAFFTYEDDGTDDDDDDDDGDAAPAAAAGRKDNWSNRSPFYLVAGGAAGTPGDKKEAYIVRWLRFSYVGTWVHHVDPEATAGSGGSATASASGLPAAVRARLCYADCGDGVDPFADLSLWTDVSKMRVAFSARGSVARDIFIRHHVPMTHQASVDADGEAPPEPLPPAVALSPEAAAAKVAAAASATAKKGGAAAAAAQSKKAAPRRRSSDDSSSDDDDDEEDDDDEVDSDDDDDDAAGDDSDSDDDELDDDVEEDSDSEEDDGDDSDDDDDEPAPKKAAPAKRAAARPPAPAPKAPAAKRARVANGDGGHGGHGGGDHTAVAKGDGDEARAAAAAVLERSLLARPDFGAADRRLRAAAAAGGAVGLLAALRDTEGPERMLAPFVLYAWGARAATGPPPPVSEIDAFFT